MTHRHLSGPEHRNYVITDRSGGSLVIKFFSPDSMRLKGDRIAHYNYPKGGCSEVGVSHLPHITVTVQEVSALSHARGRSLFSCDSDRT